MVRRNNFLVTMAVTMLLASSVLIGCGGAAPAPTAAPAKAPEPTKAPAAAEPTKAAAPAPTTAAAAPAPTQAAGPARTADYFKGKSVSVILPNSAGGGNDTTLRYVTPFVAEAAGANMLVENAPGAGGMTGFNKIAASKTDGLTWGAGSVASLVLQQISGQEGVRWDVQKINFLGRFYMDTRVLMAPAKSQVKTYDDAVKLGRPLNLPIQGLDEDNMSMFMAMNFLGLKPKLITGYQGESDVFLAAMRGEGDWAMAARITALPMIKNGDMVPVMVMSQDRSPDLPNTPTVMEVLKDQSAKEQMTAVTNVLQLLMSYFLPAGVDPGVVAEARYAVDKGLAQNPKVGAEMASKTGGRPFAYMKGEELQSKVNQIMSQSDKLKPVLKAAADSIK